MRPCWEIGIRNRKTGHVRAREQARYRGQCGGAKRGESGGHRKAFGQGQGLILALVQTNKVQVLSKLAIVVLALDLALLEFVGLGLYTYNDTQIHTRI